MPELQHQGSRDYNPGLLVVYFKSTGTINSIQYSTSKILLPKCLYETRGGRTIRNTQDHDEIRANQIYNELIDIELPLYDSPS